MLSSTLLTFAALLSAASAQTSKGFNYGATNTDNSPILEQQYQNLFTTAQNLVGTSGFTSARLYTMIQAGTTNTPTQAIQAAINTRTTLLLGIWGSGGQTFLDNEIAALRSALSQYGSAFTDLVVGISVGSEDLYRISPTGIENMSGIGAGPDVISNYIGQVRSAIAGTAASSKPVGHVDTWTAWVNGSNNAVISASDFIGMDAYPYFQTTMNNPIENGYSLFFDAYDATVNAVGGKPVWVTETGWPVSGPTENLAVPSTQNAETYWDAVGCGRLFGQINTWWYTLQDAFPTTPSPSFGVVGTTLSNTPLYDLSCSDVSSDVASLTSSSPATDATAVASSAQAGSAQAGDIPATAKIGSGNEAIGQSPDSAASLASPQTSAAAGAASDAPASSGSAPVAQPQAPSSADAPSIAAPVAPAAPGGNTPSSAQVVTQPQPNPTAAFAPTTLITQTSVLSAASEAIATASSCPASLSGNFEYPHLIVPVNKDHPDTSEGTSYNGTISPSVSSIFNFDIPSSSSGKTCTLVFLLPTQSELTTSAFSLSGSGGFDVARLSSPATESTTYNTVPSVERDLGGPSSVTPGNEYVIGSGPCVAGSRRAYEVSSTGGLDLNYFQNSSPSPIGFYVTVC